ncbi:tRNA dihydrouridine synthase B [Gracilibacillus boraciitolerans JCM 21714]|uniref:tRNA-dihydrouridine synthase n=1 Tax=Gracilibacillus boraciitolerans JCM 21714 TaxID=1298598 RepID=W4VJ60_9BACI|nr:tRNA dihydrouridine synthase B [Gracilibacillus boraciitolerans JCM 21714]
MKDNFWRDLPRPFFILAPMEDVTDVVFRHVVSEAGRPDVFFTEFTNTESYCHPQGQQSVRGRLTYTEDEQPIVAHIWGDKPELFRQMSIGMAEEGFRGVDINMGCPVHNVAANGKGCGLIRRPEVAAELIQAAKAGGLPVSVKTRLGYTDVDEWRDWLTHLLQQDIVNLSIHLRTKKEMSKVDAHWELIPEIKKLRDEVASDTLLTINGDIPDRQTGMELVQKYGVDGGVMIGRGIFTNPFAFEKEHKEPNSKEMLDLLRLHLDLFDQYSTEDERRPFKPLRRFLRSISGGFEGQVN